MLFAERSPIERGHHRSRAVLGPCHRFCLATRRTPANAHWARSAPISGTRSRLTCCYVY